MFEIRYRKNLSIVLYGQLGHEKVKSAGPFLPTCGEAPELLTKVSAMKLSDLVTQLIRRGAHSIGE